MNSTLHLSTSQSNLNKLAEMRTLPSTARRFNDKNQLDYLMKTMDPKSAVQEIGSAYLSYCRRRLLEEYFPRIKRCLDELSEADVWWRAHETDNSIGNLILHLNGNVRQWIISGVGGASDARIRAEEFSRRDVLSKADLLNTFHTNLKEADSVLREFDSQKLLEVQHIQQYDETYLDAISHVVEHFAQHLGQIIYITKLRKGIDLRFYDL